MKRLSEFRYSTSLFPLVFVTCNERLEADEVKAVLSSYEREVIRSGRKFALVVDATPVVELPSALVRRTIAEWMKGSEEIGKHAIVGMAIATSSVIVRSAMNAVSWAVPLKVPMVFEPTLEAAVAWSIERLEASGVGTTPSILAYRDALRAAAS